jgi:hypothetical protein
MSANQPTTIVDGRYFWQLVFDYDNTNNNGEFVHTYKTKYKKIVNSRDIINRKFEIKTGFSYGAKQSASIKFEGLADVGGSVEYNFHVDTAYELQTTSEKAVTIEAEREDSRTYTIGPRSKVKIYQLWYNTDGVQVATDIFATDPKPDTIVKLRFSCIKHILGFDETAELFSRIFPGSDNRDEWMKIRETIVTNLSAPQDEQFKYFVECLGSISPGHDNIEEWSLIRKTCSEIKAEFETKDHQVLFNKLLRRFSTTTPGSSNLDEWQQIRDLSKKILDGMKQNF